MSKYYLVTDGNDFYGIISQNLVLYSWTSDDGFTENLGMLLELFKVFGIDIEISDNPDLVEILEKWFDKNE